MESSFYQEHFASEDWDWWHQGRQRVLAAVLDDALGPRAQREDVDVLDVGCGTGSTTAFLGSHRRVVGCDFATEALGFSARRGLSSLVQAGAERLPFTDRSFDVVLALDVLEHHDDDARVAKELARVARPGGVVLITVPAFSFLWGPHDVISHHRRRYRMPALIALLERAGLAIKLATYFNALLFPLVLAVQTARRLIRGGAAPRPASDNPDRMPRAVNALLRETFAAEARWLPQHRFPLGVSALVVATPIGEAA